MKFITYGDLVAAHACLEQKMLFLEVFPRGSAKVSRRNLRKALKAGLSVGFCLRLVTGGEDQLGAIQDEHMKRLHALWRRSFSDKKLLWWERAERKRYLHEYYRLLLKLLKEA